MHMHTNSFNTKIASSIFFFFFLSKFTILCIAKLDIYLLRNSISCLFLHV